MTPGEQLFNIIKHGGVPMYPTDWELIHPDWKAVWEQMAIEAMHKLVDLFMHRNQLP